MHERFIRFARGCYTEIQPELAKIDKQKERDRYNYLDSQRQFVKNTLEAEERALRELIRVNEKTTKRLEAEQKKGATADARELAFHKRRLERLQDELATQEKRADEIFALLK